MAGRAELNGSVQRNPKPKPVLDFHAPRRLFCPWPQLASSRWVSHACISVLSRHTLVEPRTRLLICLTAPNCDRSVIIDCVAVAVPKSPHPTRPSHS